MVTFAVENTGIALREALVLGAAHYDEVENKKDVVPFKPNTASLDALLTAGILHIVTARDNGKLVGYFINLVAEDLLCSEVCSQELGIYVAPSHRKGSVFYRMVKFTEGLMFGLGIRQIRIMFKTGHNEQLPVKLGYEKTEAVYQKVMGDDYGSSDSHCSV